MTGQKIGVIGLGNWGTALANHLAGLGHQVTGWSIDREVVDGINVLHENPKYLSGAKLSTALKATGSADDIKGSDVFVLALPSTALSQIVSSINQLGNIPLLVSAVKGIEAESLGTPLQYLTKACSNIKEIAALSGPSFAIDLVKQLPVGVVAASEKKEVALAVANLFSSKWMRVYVSTDTLGVELGGIVKNVIALATGVSDGLGFGDSARAGLITRGLAEMIRLSKAMGADSRTLAGLSGLGDLAMTASSNVSRNRMVGLRLGAGEKLESILTSLGSVAEGVSTAPLVLKLSQKYNVEMPITEAVNELLSGKLSAKETAVSLITRPIRHELD